MTVLLTGATGRIGRHVTERLLADGRDVRALVLPGDPRRELIERPGITIVEGALDDEAALLAALAGADSVIHLAAVVTTADHPDDAYFEAIVVGTYRLLAAIRTAGRPLERFVYISSDAVYWSGGSAGADSLPITEAHRTEPGSIYGVAKLVAEELCRAQARMSGLPVAIVRPSATADAAELIDPESAFGIRMFVPSAIRAMEASRPEAVDADLLAGLRAIDDGRPRLFVIADPAGHSASMTLNDARDTAAGIVLVHDSPDAVGETFNVGPAGAHEEAALIGHIGERLGVPVATVRTPGARGDWVVGSEKAMRVLGYAPTRTAAGMVDEAVDARSRR